MPGRLPAGCAGRIDALLIDAVRHAVHAPILCCIQTEML